MSPDQRFIQNHCKNNLTPRITSILYYFPQQTCLLPNMVEMYKSIYGSFEKLSSDNYDTWKPCISTILSAMLALKIVTGEEDEDDLPIGNTRPNIAKRASYEKRQALATTAILLSCTPEVRIHLSSITNAKAMWDTLAEQLSSSSSFGRRVTISKNFSNARPNAGESVAVYLSRLNDMRVQLAGTEGAIPDERFLYHIYLTAPEDYQPMLDMMQKWPVGMATIASVYLHWPGRPMKMEYLAQHYLLVEEEEEEAEEEVEEATGIEEEVEEVEKDEGSSRSDESTLCQLQHEQPYYRKLSQAPEIVQAPTQHRQ